MGGDADDCSFLVPWLLLWLLLSLHRSVVLPCAIAPSFSTFSHYLPHLYLPHHHPTADRPTSPKLAPTVDAAAIDVDVDVPSPEELAEQRKAAANVEYKSGNYQKAAQLYGEAIGTSSW